MIRPDPWSTMPAKIRETTCFVPEAAPLTNFVREREMRCDGCGEMVAVSKLETRRFIRGMIVRTCKGKNCWRGWKTKNGK